MAPKYPFIKLEPTTEIITKKILETGGNNGQICSKCGHKIPKNIHRLRIEKRMYNTTFTYTLCPTCLKEACKELTRKEVKEWEQTMIIRKLQE